MNIDIETLLVNSILKGDNPNRWRGTYVRHVFEQKLGQPTLNHNALHYVSNDNVKVSQCWMASGDCVDVISHELSYISYRLFLQSGRPILLISYNDYYITPQEYILRNGSTTVNTLMNLIVDANEQVELQMEKWESLISKCQKKAQVIMMQESAAKALLTKSTLGTHNTFTVQTTSEGSVVHLAIPGERVESISILPSDNVVDKIKELLISIQ